MGEIEGLDTDEPLPKRIERHAFDRLIMLSDGVFAIAVTLAALEIRPEGAVTDAASLWRALQVPLLSYALSFGVIAAYWLTHRDLFARLRRVDSPLTALTLAMLFAVALLPATTRLVYAADGGRAAFQVYAASIIAVGVVQVLLWSYVSLRPQLLLPGVPRGYRWSQVLGASLAPLFFVWVIVTKPDMTGSGSAGLLIAATIVLLVRRVIRPALTRLAR